MLRPFVQFFQHFARHPFNHILRTSKIVQPRSAFSRTRRHLTAVFVVSTGLGYIITLSQKDKEKEDSQLKGTEPWREWSIDVLAENLGKENWASVLEALFKGDSVLSLKVQELPTKGKRMDDGKVVSDLVHGHIELHPVCVAIIDTPQFQRLRYLKQMGTCEFVYPGAVHTRFEHSLGVCHLAGMLIKSLRQKQPELQITDKDVLCVQIAGLCHDMGHGPFSHMFDNIFIPAVDSSSTWKHEQASAHMFEYMYHDAANTKLREAFEKYGLDKTDITFIKEQIEGPRSNTSSVWEYQGRPQEKAFLYEIVANKRNGIDVDKWDYLSRDCLHLGMKSNFDHHRFIHFARVISVDNEPQICLREKKAYGIHQMYENRYGVHKKACEHRVNSAIGLMIVDALIEVNEVIKIPKADGTKVKMSECIKQENMDAFQNLTDEIIRKIVLKPDHGDPHLKKAKQLLQDLWGRKKYMFVAESSPIKGRPFRDAQKKTIKDEVLGFLKADRTIEPETLADLVHILKQLTEVELVNFDYGMKGKNPWKHIHFYSKNRPDVAKLLPTQKVSFRLPENFEEQIVRVFFKPTNDPVKNEEYVIILRRAFKAWYKEKVRKRY